MFDIHLFASPAAFAAAQHKAPPCEPSANYAVRNVLGHTVCLRYRLLGERHAVALRPKGTVTVGGRTAAIDSDAITVRK